MPRVPTQQSLHYESDGEQAHLRPQRLRELAARRLESLGTTANSQRWQDNIGWTSDLEYVWRNRTRNQREVWEDRAKRIRGELRAMDRAGAPACPQTRVEMMRSEEWATEHARALALSRSDVVNTCRTRWRKTRCACSERQVRVGCDAVMLCDWCRRRHWRKWRKDITRSLDAHVRAARGWWSTHGKPGMVPGVYLVTLTGPHTGDIEADRRRMGAAWRKLSKVGRAANWWGHYAATWEVTPGVDTRGHVHLHVACVSSWVPYDELHEAWRRAMPGALVLDVRAPTGSRKQAASAANYLAKYVTKGVQPEDFTGAKAGELLVAFRGKRKVTTSLEFWIPVDYACRQCGCYHRMVEAPCSLQDVAPGAVLRAHAERLRWFIPRGEVQMRLDWNTT